MSTKKKLITRMALWTGAVLAVALLMAGAALALMHSGRQRFEDEQKAERQQVLERSRKYLGELAKRIDRLPVDPTLVGEIESRYFEEQASGPMHVWAMGTGGEFLFGVPKESFSRLNAVYDREITPRLKEGVFFDRQSFLLGHLDEGEDLVLGELAGEEGGPADMRALLRRRADRSDGAFVLSAPLKTADGVALGSLYLMRAGPERDWYREDERLKFVAAAGGAVATLAFVFLWILLPTWVYVDGSERRSAARASLRLPHGDLLAHRPRRVPHLPARRRQDARLPGLRARGERRGLLSALRPGPVGLLLPGLPLPAEARLGLLPLVPDGDQAPVDGHDGSVGGRLASPRTFPNRTRTARVPPAEEDPCPCRSDRRGSARPR